jgi:2'-5' RNA ligase
MDKRHRIFIAINLPGDIKKELFSYYEKWPELPARWTAKENLHITLEFLGDLTDQEIGEVCMAVKEVAERHESFSLNISQIVYGPTKLKPNQAPKFLWATGEKSKELTVLRKDLEETLTQKISFIPEERNFAPHITLARIGTWEWKGIEPEERPEINENLDLMFTVESIEVMESELKKGGPVYTVLESHNLK